VNITTLASLVDRLPPGRARRRYERLLAEMGGEMVAVTVPYVHGPLWFVTGMIQAKSLAAMGVPRWRVWTLHEANTLLEACGSPAAAVSEAAQRFGSTGA
jgi:hypothetical protein